MNRTKTNLIHEFWKYCSRKNVAARQAHFGSTVPGKTSPRVKRILEVLFPEKMSAGERSSAGPILPFFIFIFPGTVLPFCYFSVVRKVPEKPVLFLPHPWNLWGRSKGVVGNSPGLHNIVIWSLAGFNVKILSRNALDFVSNNCSEVGFRCGSYALHQITLKHIHKPNTAK